MYCPEDRQRLPERQLNEARTASIVFAVVLPSRYKNGREDPDSDAPALLHRVLPNKDRDCEREFMLQTISVDQEKYNSWTNHIVKNKTWSTVS